jgi:HEAT repeat protein
MQTSSAVFVGLVVETSEGGAVQHGDVVTWREPQAVFVVERSWKGVAAGNRVEAATRYGPAVEKGVRYLVYTCPGGESGAPRAVCERTRKASEASLEIGLLDAIVRGGPAEVEAMRRLPLALGGDPSDDVRAEAARLLGMDLPAEVAFSAMDGLLAALEDRAATVRRTVLEAVHRGPWMTIDERHRPTLGRAVISVLDDADAGVREVAARLVQNYRTLPETPPALAAALDSERKKTPSSPGVVRALVASIAVCGTRESRRAVVPLLVADLGDGEMQVRVQAANSLKAIGPDARPAAAALQAALGDTDQFVRYHAALALGAIGVREATARLVEALADREPDVRAQAASALYLLGDDAVLSARVVPALVATVGQHRDFKLYHVLRVLGEMGPSAHAAVPALRAALVRVESLTLAFAVEALGHIGPRARAGVPDLVALVPSPDERVALAAVQALGRIDDRGPSVVAALRARVKAEPQYVGESALAVLHRWRVPAALRLVETDTVPGLAKALAATDRDVRRDAAWRLVSWGRESAAAVPALSAALSDRDEWVRQHSALALGAIGPAAAPAVPGLIRLLAHPTARVAATSSLGEIGPAAAPAVPSLLPLLEDPGDAVRCGAAQALRRIGTAEASAAFEAFAAREVPRLARRLADREHPEHGEGARHLVALAPATRDVIPVLVAALRDDPDWLARTKSAEALGALGSLADSGVPALADALADRSSWVRDAARTALAGIGSPQARRALEAFVTSPR